MRIKNVFWMLVAALLIIHCKKETSKPFLIQKDQVGKLFKATTVDALDSIYAKDSIIKRIGEGDYASANKDQYLIYEKGGKHLLTLSPAQQHDSTEVITHVQIIDPRFTTAKGIHINSTFKDIKSHYTLSKIHTTFNNVLIFIDSINTCFTIDKKILPETLQQPNINIKIYDIPDDARIKYFMIGWE